ncbi:hypothetical protein Tco_1163452 [Tanacetum coccineum]
MNSSSSPHPLCTRVEQFSYQRYSIGALTAVVHLSSLFDSVSCLPFGSLKMSDVERVDIGSQAEGSSSSKRDMGSYTSTMKPSDVKALTRKYKIPMDLHPVVMTTECVTPPKWVATEYGLGNVTS